MMKISILLFLLTFNIYSKTIENKQSNILDANHIQKLKVKDIKLKLINIDQNDTLNLRGTPSNKGKIIKRIPYNSNKLNTKGKISGNWVYINYLDNTNNSYSGWVYAKYITPIYKNLFLTYNNYKISYPFYLKVTEKENNWINFKHTIPYKHSQYLDGKNGEIEKKYIDNIDLDLKIYDNFNKAINDNYLIQDYNYNKKEFTKYEPLQKLENGFKLRLGHEGVGKIAFIINHNNKTLVYFLKYNINKITPLEEKKKIYLLTEKEKIKIIQEISNSIEYK